MFNAILLIASIMVVTLPFLNEALLREHHTKKLQERFADWWLHVQYQGKTDVALACASIAEKFLNRIFGEELFRSKKVWLRSSVIASCLLVGTLAFTGLLDKNRFTVTPWRNYRETVALVTSCIDTLFSKDSLDYFREIEVTKTNIPPFYKNTNNYVLHVGSNYFLVLMKTNVIRSIRKMEPLGHGEVTLSYDRIWRSGNPNENTDTNSDLRPIDFTSAMDGLSDSMMAVKKFTLRHSTYVYVFIYSVAYFVVLFALNIVFFIVSQATCRIMLREIVKVRAVFASASLFITNLLVALVLSCAAVAFYLVIAAPFLWFFFPHLFQISRESLLAGLLYCIAGSVGLWVASATSVKLIVLILLLPTMFAIGVGGFSLMAINWKGAFHYVVSRILIRFAEKNPLAVLITTFLFIVGMLTLLAKLFHWTSMLL